MTEEDVSFQDLINEALDNAREDRRRAKEAYEKMKPIFDIDPGDTATLQAVMLVGQQAVKLIESISSSNEQVLKAAGMKQKEKPKIADDIQEGPVDVDDLREKLANQGQYAKLDKR